MIGSYFRRIVELRDQLGDIGEIVSDKYICTYVLRGLPDSCESFIQSASGCSKIPKYDRLWVHCSEEDARLAGKHGNTYDENQALLDHSSHQKGKKKFVMKDFYRKDHDDRRYDGSSYSSNRKDYSKVQCFGCKELGHIK